MLLQNTVDEIVITPELEKRLQVAVEIIRLNTSIYEKYINDVYDPFSKEYILTRIQLQRDLIAISSKQAELEQELLRLEE